jgi:L1 cell adhesion molecule like protein
VCSPIITRMYQGAAAAGGMPGGMPGGGMGGAGAAPHQGPSVEEVD